jgi:hypothetical protein
MRTAVVALLAAACGGPPRATAPPEHRDNHADPAPPAIDRKLLADVAAGHEEVLAAMAQITAGTDCPAMGAQLHELFARSAPLFELARTQGANPDAAAVLTAEMNTRADRVRPLVETIGAGLERCHTEPTVVDAIQSMPTF